MYMFLVTWYFTEGKKNNVTRFHFGCAVLDQRRPETTLVSLTFHQSADLAALDVWISD